MHKYISRINSRGSVIIYSLLLTFFAVTAAYLLVMKSETLYTNLENSKNISKLDSTISILADRVIKYASSLNIDGNGFTDTLKCPNDFTLTNTSSWTVTYVGASSPVMGTWGIVTCLGTSTPQLGNYSIEYASTGSGFVSVSFMGINHQLSVSWTTSRGQSFTWPGGFQYQVSFSNPTVYSWIDINGNSDDRLSTSTGTTAYPMWYSDNDALWRQILYGYIEKNTGFNSLIWSNARTNNFIRANVLNNGSFIPGNILSWAIYMTIDGPYTLRIEEYDRAQYMAKQELRLLTWSTVYSSTGGVGYLQSNFSLSGEYWSTWALVWARMFDFANRDYGLFLSYSWSLLNPDKDILRYQLKASTSTWGTINIVPLNDENSREYRLLAGIVMFTSSGERLAKMTEVTRGIE